jgi:hypothetical protein
MDGPLLTPLGQIKSALHEATFAAMQELGGMIQDDAHEQLSVAYPPASSAGEKPHRRTGALAAGTNVITNRSDSGVETTVAFSRAGGDPGVPVYLEQGTGKMAARPFAAPLRDEWAEKSASILPGLIMSRFSISK